MPVLPITAEELSGPAARSTIGKVEAVMLFPNDPGLQDRAWASCTADMLLSAIEGGCVELDDLGEPGAVARLLRTAPRAVDLQTKAHQSYRYGLAAGIILMEMITADARNEVVSMVRAKEKVSEHLTVLNARSMGTIENTVWKTFRPVAHFWAAYLCLGSEACDRDEEYLFPCSVKALAEFLGTAQSYLERGLSLRAARSARTVLVPDETWTLPARLDLPRFVFEA